MIEIKYNVLYGIGLNYYSDQYFLTLFINSDLKTRDIIIDFRKFVYFTVDFRKQDYEFDSYDYIIQFEIPKTSLSVTGIRDMIISDIKDLMNNETKQLMNIDSKINYMNFFSRLFIKYGDIVKIYDL